MLSVTIKPIILSVAKLSVAKLNVIILNVVMLSVIMLSVTMLNVAAPSIRRNGKKIFVQVVADKIWRFRSNKWIQKILEYQALIKLSVLTYIC